MSVFTDIWNAVGIQLPIDFLSSLFGIVWQILNMIYFAITNPVLLFLITQIFIIGLSIHKTKNPMIIMRNYVTYQYKLLVFVIYIFRFIIKTTYDIVNTLIPV